MNNSKRSPFLIIMCGLSGSGKSTVSQFLARRFQAAWIQADIERKQLFDLSPPQSSKHLQADIYAPEVTERVFKNMCQRAEVLLKEGNPVIIDSCALKRSERELFSVPAQQMLIPVIVIYCKADQKTLIRRIEHRQNFEDDPSEASEDIILKQVQWLERPSKKDTLVLIELNSEDINWKKTLYSRVLSLISHYSDNVR